MGIMTFLLNNKALIAIVLLAIALGASLLSNKVLRGEKEVLVAQKTQIKDQLDISQSNIVQLKNDIQFQNDQISVFKTAADDKKAANVETIAKAFKDSDVFKKEAAVLLTRTFPSDAPTCSSANELMNEEIRNAQR